jgi:hypothetical protein
MLAVPLDGCGHAVNFGDIHAQPDNHFVAPASTRLLSSSESQQNAGGTTAPRPLQREDRLPSLSIRTSPKKTAGQPWKAVLLVVR